MNLVLRFKTDADITPSNYWGGSYGSILGAYLVNM
jgi:hypothetical protein